MARAGPGARPPAAAQVLAERLDEVARRSERLGDAEAAHAFVARLRALETVPAFRVLAARAYDVHDDPEHERVAPARRRRRRRREHGRPGQAPRAGGGRRRGGRVVPPALAGGHWPALYVLDHLLPAQGPALEERRMQWLLAAEAGWLPALEWMVTRGAATDEERAHWAALPPRPEARSPTSRSAGSRWPR